MQPLRSAPRCQRGFSLVELLIVASIIAALVLIALPAIGSLRERSQAAGCVSLLKQIVAAEGAYSVDNQNYLVPYQIWRGETAAEGYSYWSALLFPYISSRGAGDFLSGSNGNNRWFLCPGQKARRADRSVPPGIGPVFGNWSSGHLLHSMPYAGATARVPAKKRAEVAHPSKTASWMDVQGGTNNGFPAYCRGCYPRGGISSASHGVTDGNNFSDRHFNGANVAFVDGHIEWLPIETLRNVPTANAPGIWHHHDDL